VRAKSFTEFRNAMKEAKLGTTTMMLSRQVVKWVSRPGEGRVSL